MNTKKIAVSVVAALSLAAGASAQAVKVDPAIPAYQRASGVSGTLNGVGSDTIGI